MEGEGFPSIFSLGGVLYLGSLRRCSGKLRLPRARGGRACAHHAASSDAVQKHLLKGH